MPIITSTNVELTPIDVVTVGRSAAAEAATPNGQVAGNGIGGAVVPGPPLAVSAAPLDSSSIVTFSPPTSNGGSTIVAYRVTSYLAPGYDPFLRSAVASGWGTAPVGGLWTPAVGTASNFSTTGTAGQITLPSGTTQGIALEGISASTVTVNFDVNFKTLPTAGNFVYAFAWMRIDSGLTDFYRVGLFSDSTGLMCLRAEAVSVANGSVTVFPDATPTVFGTYTPNTWMTVKAHLAGASPTTVGVEAWPQGTTEPGYQVTATDATGPQTAGFVGIRSLASGNAITVLFDNFQVVIV